jgi:hypothetical protein
MVIRRLAGVLLALVLRAACAAAPAGAADPPITPIRIGDGDTPNVTVDAAGTAHIAWRGAGANSAQLFYCRLPRGASDCAVRTQIAAPGDSLTLPIAVADGNTVAVVSYRYGLSGPSFAAVMEFISTDGGASFGGGNPIGTHAPFDYALGPGLSLSIVTNAETVCGMCFEQMPLDGGAAAGPAHLSSDHPYLGTVTLLDNLALAVFTDGSANAQFRRYGGVGDPNNEANWTPPVDIGPIDIPHLVSGPSGTFLLGATGLSGPEMEARRFNGSTFGAPVTVARARPDHAAEDAQGRIHAVASQYSSGPTGAALFYATSDDGANWATRQTDFSQFPVRMRMAVAADHIGWVVGAFGSGAPGVWATPIGPTADVPRLGAAVGVTVIKEPVLIKRKGSASFVPLRGGDVIPTGSTIDATKGRVRITSVLPNGKLQSSDFYEGVFTVTQAKTGLTDLKLAGGSFRSCPRSSSASLAKVKVIRHLWGDGKGKFRTKGRYASATVRGTTWNTIDRCDATQIRVTRGSVLVRDNVKKKNVVVKAGRSYLAKSR